MESDRRSETRKILICILIVQDNEKTFVLTKSAICEMGEKISLSCLFCKISRFYRHIFVLSIGLSEGKGLLLKKDFQMNLIVLYK